MRNRREARFGDAPTANALSLRGRRRTWASAAAGALLTILTTPAIAFAQTYTAIDLGTLPGEVTSSVRDINNRGQVIGTSGSQSFIWDAVNGMRPLPAGASRINDLGIVAGVRFEGGQTQPYVWIDGAVIDLPHPPGDTITGVAALTDNNILMMCGTNRCWGFYLGAYYDLPALTGGASIVALNEMTTMGGHVDGVAYLRFPDGRTITPWPVLNPFMISTFGSVEVIGPAGHFAGRGGADAWYGFPDGRAVPMGISMFVRTGFDLNDINRAGHLVGTYHTHIMLPQLDAGFLYADGRLTDLRQAVVSGPSGIRAAMAINDAGFIAADAVIDSGERRAVLLTPVVPPGPTNLTFSIAGNVVTLSWTGVPGVASYIVEAGSAPGLADLYVADVGAQTSFTTPAPPGRYYVRVRGRSPAGITEASNEIIVDVP